MIVIGPRDFHVMPWKNGLGSTTELYRADGPDGEMDWRVSIASVAADGPFSHFPGCDRHIMVLDGDGMILDGGPHGSIAVFPALTPATFSGDWQVTARLVGGTCRDFNLFVRRSFGRGRMTVATISSLQRSASEQATTLLYCISGVVTCNGQEIACGSVALMRPAEGLELVPRGGPAQVAVCRVWKADQS